jgi:hypothetical protein
MQVGDKVVCINALIDADKLLEISKDFQNWITKDETYTVREILFNDGIVDGILLEEVYNVPKWFKLINRLQEPAFATWRFRKMEEDKIQVEMDEIIEIYTN